MAAYLLLLLPALAMAKVQVQVSGELEAGSDSPNMKVYLSGNELGIITNVEQQSFKLSDDNMKAGVESYFGKRPSDVYVRSPTPFGDLYQTYGWDQVLRTLVPKSAKVVSASTQPTIVMKQIFENNSTKDATFNVGISHEIRNTVSSKWSSEDRLSVGAEIGMEVDFIVSKIGTKASMSMGMAYGEESEKSQSVTMGSTSDVQVLLHPGQKVMSELHASRSMILLEVEYEASLSGKIAVNYDDVFKGHHFWGMDVEAVMASRGLKNKISSKQIVEIGFYSNSQVVVRDIVSEKKLLTVAF